MLAKCQQTPITAPNDHSTQQGMDGVEELTAVPETACVAGPLQRPHGLRHDSHNFLLVVTNDAKHLLAAFHSRCAILDPRS
jgi:hypothetical protein